MSLSAYFKCRGLQQVGCGEKYKSTRSVPRGSLRGVASSNPTSGWRLVCWLDVCFALTKYFLFWLVAYFAPIQLPGYNISGLQPGHRPTYRAGHPPDRARLLLPRELYTTSAFSPATVQSTRKGDCCTALRGFSRIIRSSPSECWIITFNKAFFLRLFFFCTACSRYW